MHNNHFKVSIITINAYPGYLLPLNRSQYCKVWIKSKHDGFSQQKISATRIGC